MNSDRKYSLNYGQMLKDRMSVVFDDIGIEAGEEVERMEYIGREIVYRYYRL